MTLFYKLWIALYSCTIYSNSSFSNKLIKPKKVSLSLSLYFFLFGNFIQNSMIFCVCVCVCVCVCEYMSFIKNFKVILLHDKMS